MCSSLAGWVAKPTCSFAHDIGHAVYFRCVKSFVVLTATPIRFVSPIVHKSMKAEVRSIVRASHEAVLNGIRVNIVANPFELVLVADGSLPEAPVPFPSFRELPPLTAPVGLGFAGTT